MSNRQLGVPEQIAGAVLKGIFKLIGLIFRLLGQGIKALFAQMSDSKNSSAKAPPPPLPTQHPSGKFESARPTLEEQYVAQGEQMFEENPDLAQSEPNTFRKTTLGLMGLYAKLLGTIDLQSAVNRDNPDLLTWRDANVAAKAREWATRGLYHGDQYCSLVGDKLDADENDKMAFLHCMGAVISRLDHDYNKAFVHNCARLRYDTPDSISENTIEGMLSDAHRAGGAKKSADMLNLFSALADEKPEWEQLTPMIRRVVAIAPDAFKKN